MGTRRPPPQNQARRVGVKMLIEFFDRDDTKAEQLRTRMAGKTMVRKDRQGRRVIENELTTVERRKKKQPKAAGAGAASTGLRR